MLLVKANLPFSDITGGCNVNIGYTAGFCITSGCDNVIIGKDTARCIETGCGNVYIGKRLDYIPACVFVMSL